METTTSNFNLAKFLVKWMWRIYIAGTLFVLLFFSVIRFNVFGLWGKIPSFQLLEKPDILKASIIYSEDGIVLGKYFGSANRVDVPFEQISPEVIKALIATEDERFEEHSGIDGRSMLRVLKGVLTLNLDGGGSTISQQLAKNLFDLRTDKEYQGVFEEDSKPKLIGTKIKEWITATWLEKAYTKEEIIVLYLNTVSQGVRAKGIFSGAKVIFNKHCKDLNLQEAATLVGTYKANYSYDPISNPERSKSRRNQVFGQMARSGFIKEELLDSLNELPLITDHSPDSYNKGTAAYFRSAIRSEVQSLIKDDYDLTEDGIKIYTTINYNLQKIAEKQFLFAMKKNQERFMREWGTKDPWSKEYFIKAIKRSDDYKRLAKEFPEEKVLWDELRKPRNTKIFTYEEGEKDTLISVVNKVRHYGRILRGAMLAVDHSNGHVKAWVGGIDKQHFNYDMVQKGERQVGSTFKPILYSLAIKNGYQPCTEFANVPKTITYEDGKVWEPRVPKSIDGEDIYLKDALKKSLNNIAAQLIDQLGTKQVVDFASQFDIDKKKLPENLSLVLGTSNLKMEEIIRPYQTIANQGNYVKPVKILKVTTEKGKVLYQYKPESKKLLSEMEAYKMVTMMRGVTKDGTGKAINRKYNLLAKGNQIGGKTGTTQNSKDCWFIGFDKNLAIATWVGAENNNISYKNTRLLENLE